MGAGKVVEVEYAAPPRVPSRSEASELAILEAALSLVAEVGYDRLSMDALAERARASKATIYRRWSGKAEVVAAAMRQRSAHSENDLVDTGSLRGDLLAHFQKACDAMSEKDGALVAGLLRAMQGDPELAQLIRTQMLDSKLATVEEVVKRAVARGELAADADAATATEVMTAVTFARLLLTGELLDEAFCLHLADDIVIPLLHR
jgi:AcrR family transcriptional regulator